MRNSTELRVNLYAVMEECVDSGIRFGLKKKRENKKMTDEELAHQIKTVIMEQIDTYFNFPDNI